MTTVIDRHAAIARRCRECDAPIPAPPNGRPPERCSATCRRLADSRRQRDHRRRMTAELRELRALRDSLRQIVAA
jgi:hypothetical protein